MIRGWSGVGIRHVPRMFYKEVFKVNFVNTDPSCLRMSKSQSFLWLLVVLVLLLCFVGCSDEVQPVTTEHLTRFRNAGFRQPSIDVDHLVSAKIGGGPHRALPGEVLELTMPTILQIVTADEPEISGKMAPHICRISDAGTITLPVVGELTVQGKTLTEIESAVISAYYPEYTVTQPSVFASILEYKTADVSITGAVNKPGIYSLRTDQMSLVALLMEAEGIVDGGAAFIRVVHADQEEDNDKSAKIGRIYQSVEQKSGMNEGRLSPPLVRYAEFSEIDVQLKFRPLAASSTRGGLTITDGQKTLLNEHLDISNESERKFMLDKLLQKEPRVSTAVVNQRLCTLAELLNSNSGKRNGGDKIATQNTKSFARLDNSMLESHPWQEKPAEKVRLVSAAVHGHGLHASAAPKLGYGLLESRPGVISENVGLYDKFNTGDPGWITAPIETVYKIDSTRSAEISEPSESLKPREDIPLVLPVKGLNIPFADVALRDGDRIIVEPLREPLITVVGLVNRAGNFPYPSGVEYNLMHALGFAGGLNLSAEPRYATIYRLAADGTTVSATFNVAGIAKSVDPSDALSVVLKPYDVIAVEHTPRTRAKVFWDRVFRFYISTYIRAEDIFGDD